MSKFKSSGVIRIGDDDFQWRVTRFGGASNAYENQRGLAVSVSLESGSTRELVIEFPFTDYLFSLPTQQTAFEDRLRAAIMASIETGWRPSSRGKAFVYAVRSST